MSIWGDELARAARSRETLRAEFEALLCIAFARVRVAALPLECTKDGGVLLVFEVLGTRELTDAAPRSLFEHAEDHLRHFVPDMRLLHVLRLSRLVVRRASGDAYPYVDYEPFVRVVFGAHEQALNSK